jgi:hypothetical protein
MAVHDDQSRSVENERTLHYLPRIYRRVIDRPALMHFVSNKETSQSTKEWVAQLEGPIRSTSDETLDVRDV